MIAGAEGREEGTCHVRKERKEGNGEEDSKEQNRWGTETPFVRDDVDDEHEWQRCTINSQ